MTDDSPRPYNLDDPEELRRLLFETIGYARVSLDRKDGTDHSGRILAYEALLLAVDLGFGLRKACFPVGCSRVVFELRNGALFCSIDSGPWEVVSGG